MKESLKSIRDDYAYWYDIVSLENAAYGNPEVLADYRVLTNSTTGNKKKLIKKQYQLRRSYCPIEIVTGRVKSPDSILDKAKRMNVKFENISKEVYDIGGVRITCKYIEDVYKVADLLKSRKDVKLVEERDYIKNIKASGYRSLHLIMRYNVETIDGQVPIILEFQIRTHAMHFWASIEHSLKYKYQNQIFINNIYLNHSLPFF